MPTEHITLNELVALPPVEHSRTENLHSRNPDARSGPAELHRQRSKRSIRAGRLSTGNSDVPDDFINLDELAAPSPVENPYQRHKNRQHYLEESRSQTRSHEGDVERDPDGDHSLADDSDGQAAVDGLEPAQPTSRASRVATELHTVSYLILFSILGTLARLGLQALTAYPGNPVTTSVLWANVAGSIIMGFLSEDQRLFQGHGIGDNDRNGWEKRDDSDGTQDATETAAQSVEARKAHIAMKKTIPLYIGLSTGFCGSFTSFSSFIRDVFLELANQPLAISPSNSPAYPTISRSGGYSFMAVVAVIILTLCLCLSALKIGAHFAIGLKSFTPSVPAFLTSKTFNRGMVLFSWGLWLGAVVMAIWPPDRASGPAADSSTSGANGSWRGRVLFSLVFAPLGCILRFYASLRLNGVLTSFPLGTFVVNASGTAILGMCWDLQHASLGAAGDGIGGRVGCQVLQGVEDGFCGCLTTISTWVLELMGLRRKHAYVYGGISIGTGLAFLVVIMGSLIWSGGASATGCSV